MRLFKKFNLNTTGATAVEYGLLSAVVGVAIMGGLTSVGDGVSQEFNALKFHMSGDFDAITEAVSEEALKTMAQDLVDELSPDQADQFMETLHANLDNGNFAEALGQVAATQNQEEATEFSLRMEGLATMTGEWGLEKDYNRSVEIWSNDVFANDPQGQSNLSLALYQTGDRDNFLAAAQIGADGGEPLGILLYLGNGGTPTSEMIAAGNRAADAGDQFALIARGAGLLN